RLNQTLLVWLSCEGDSRISLLKSIRDELRRSVQKLLIVRIKPDLMPADIVRVVCLQLTRNRDDRLPANAFLTPQMSRLGVETDHPGTDKLLSLKNGFDRGQQFSRRIRLDEVAACTRA